MMKTSLILTVTLLTFVTSLALVDETVAAEPVDAIFESSIPPTPANPLDKIVFAKLASLDIQPVLCSDAVFVRRAYLDMTGTLPTAQEARQFIQDPDTDKRRALVDHLLEQDEFADYWAMKWGDVLRIKAEFPVNLWPNAAQAYHRWVRASIVENKPYDQFARELLTSSGSNFRVGPANFYRAIQDKTPEGIANATALTFMGSRTDYWSKDILPGTAVFFSQIGYKPTREWKEECVFWDPLGVAAPPPAEGEPEKPPVPPPLGAIFPDGTKLQLSPNQDPREVFADWLITPENPWFTRCIVNRVWAWLLGRGIVHEPDDIRDDNPPSNPELLAYLEKELIASNYDLKRFYRMILTSKTYQFSSILRFDTPEAKANFASYPLRRLEAEVLIDAVNQITGTTDLYTSPIPEPFTYIPKDMSAVAVADGSITSPFLALFGRSARATGMATERNNKLGSAQWLHMLNSSHIQTKLEQSPKLKALFASGRKSDELVEEFYLTILSRFPTADEMARVKKFTNSASMDKSGKVNFTQRRNAVLDIVWSLINSTEFLYRH